MGEYFRNNSTCNYFYDDLTNKQLHIVKCHYFKTTTRREAYPDMFFIYIQGY
jgi:hypothetical protein